MINGFAPGAIDFHRTLAVAWCAYSTVIELRRDLPDQVGGICWYAVDNPGQSPHIPIFSGTTKLPKAFDSCGHKGFNPDCVLWQFRKANKLATLNWKKTKEGFQKVLKKTEDSSWQRVSEAEKQFEAASSAASKAKVLNRCTSDVHSAAAAKWQGLEKKYWEQFGRGF